MVYFHIIFISTFIINTFNFINFVSARAKCEIELVTVLPFTTKKIDIIHKGAILPSWQEISKDSYMANQFTDIQYFYLVCFKPNNTTETAAPASSAATSADSTGAPATISPLTLATDDIITLTSNDTINAGPTVNIIKEETKYDDHNFDNIPLETKAIEVTYNCGIKAHIKLKLTLTIKLSTCEKPFQIVWEKLCIPRDHAPSVNIGFTPRANDIMQNGKFVQNFPLENNGKILLPKEISSISLYLSYSKPEKSLEMKVPNIMFDENDLSVVTAGFLMKGGILTNKVDKLTLAFICFPFKLSKSDVQISLDFGNLDMINLFFIKECDNIGEMQEYYYILNTIYWIVILLVIVFFAAFLMFCLKKRDMTLWELTNKVVEYIKNYYNNCFSKSYSVNSLRSLSSDEVRELKQNKYHELHEEVLEENDIISVNIKPGQVIEPNSNNCNNDKDRANNINNDNNSLNQKVYDEHSKTNNLYGGI